MSRYKRRRQTEGGRLSIFFIVALAIGVALLFWLFAMTLRHPSVVQPKGRPPHLGQPFHDVQIRHTKLYIE